jgi:hypothetical protein
MKWWLPVVPRVDSFGGLGAWVAAPPSAAPSAAAGADAAADDRDDDTMTGPLISQYITPRGGSAGRYDVWMLPMRKPVAAQMADGTPFLRLGYWPGNDALLGPSVEPQPPSTSEIHCGGGGGGGGGYAVTWITELDATTHATGAFLFANLSVSSGGGSGGGSSVGFAIEYPGTGSTASFSQGSVSTAVLLTVGLESDDAEPGRSNATILRVDAAPNGTGQPRTTTIDTAGAFACGGRGAHPNSNTATTTTAMCGVASVTSIAPGSGSSMMPHTARLFLRRGMWELYIDDVSESERASQC